ncbi:MAG TPA: preprotein translocase subunit SecA, partial [Candidatus Latescibacteria bacterium]|nr:preprotein translocase subunit SecA [Candidatus Latescibacterota bacterium]
MLSKVLTKVFGSKYERDIKRLRPIVAQINELYEQFHSLSDEQMREKTRSFMARIEEERGQIRWEMEGEDPEEVEKAVKRRQEETLDEILPEAYALVKEACRRLVGQKWEVRGREMSWDMIPYDVQIMGAIVLHEGKIAEMATGEGKTLAATMPLYLNALVGRGAHLVTVNDYLAARDREWMGPIYEFLGLTVDHLQNEWDTQRRRQAYQAHITYGTNNEFGFDYLRDNYNTYSPEDLVQRELYYAIVDEV